MLRRANVGHGLASDTVSLRFHVVGWIEYYAARKPLGSCHRVEQKELRSRRFGAA
jgi:hypothetical protein